MTLSAQAQAAILDARTKVIDRHENPLLESLPDWTKQYRPHQEIAIRQVIDGFGRAPVVVLDAPTGSGKTLIGETVRRLLRQPAVYMCTSRSLQDQFLRDYSYAKVLKGRANYPTAGFPERFTRQWDGLSCDDCTWSITKSCKWCPSKASCPYEIAKWSALRAPIAVLNTSYFLAEANHIGRFSKRELVIADEADELESSLMDFVSVNISERRLKMWRWDPPTKVTVKESWQEWLEDKVKDVADRLRHLPRSEDPKKDRERRFVTDLGERLKLVLGGLDEDAWVYTGRATDDKRGRQGVSFKPARVDFLGNGLLWDHSQRWLLMSATVISAQEMLESLGYQGDYEVVRVANTFPIENRKVVVRGVANMAQKNAEASWPKVGAALKDVLTAHPDVRILVHSVSYRLTAFLVGELTGCGREIVSYTSADGREHALARFKATDAAVLIGPSLDRGVDLPGDACRVQVLVKVPYGNIGDRQIVTRLYSRGGKVWYTVQTIRQIVQSCGRAVRSADDYAETIILDSQFKDKLWNEGRGLFPKWFVEAIQWH